MTSSGRRRAGLLSDGGVCSGAVLGPDICLHLHHRLAEPQVRRRLWGVGLEKLRARLLAGAHLMPHISSPELQLGSQQSPGSRCQHASAGHLRVQ
jgi:hypothetical protein